FTVAFGTEEDAQLERHVESGKMAAGIGLRPGDVVDPEPTAFDQVEDLLDSDLAPVIQLEGAPRPEAAVEDCKGDRLEEQFVSGVERTVDEDLPPVPGRLHGEGDPGSRPATWP